MIFYIALGTFVLVALVTVIAAASAAVRGRDLEDRIFGPIFIAMLGCFVAIAPCLASIGPWWAQAEDLSRIFAQDEVIKVQVERIESLTTRLNKFNYPRSALLNADTPVAAIVTAINDAEKRLAYAKTEKAEAIRSIEQRRYGPFSGAIHFVGDYK